MKYFLLFVFFLFFFSFVSATEVSVLQENYLAGETVQVYVNATSLSSSDIVLSDVNHSTKTIAPLFTEYRDGQYFVSFDLSENYYGGLYTLEIQDASDTFTLIPLAGQPVLRLKPAFILLDTSDDTFHFELSNIGESSATLYVTDSDNALSSRKNEISINPGEERNLYVDYVSSRIDSDLFINISYDDQYYILPVIYPDLLVEETVVEEDMSEEIIEETVPEGSPSFALLITEPSVTLNIASNQSRYGDLKVQNLLNESITLDYSLTGDLEKIVVLNQSSVTLAAGEIYSQRVWFNPANNSREGEYSGLIVLSDGIFSQNISVDVSVVENAETTSEEDVLEEQSSEEYLVYEGETLAEEESNIGLYAIAVFMILLLVALIILVALKLRQKNEKKFTEYIEGTKKRK